MTRVERALWGFAVAVLLLHVYGAFAPGPNVWGFHQWAFLPRPLFWIAAALAFLFCLPPVAARFDGFARRLGAPGAARAVSAVTLGLLVVLWFVFRQRVFLLSDGMLLIRSVTQGFVNFAADTLAAVIQLRFHWLLDALFHPGSATASFRIVSIACGAVWITALFAAVGRLVPDGRGRFILGGLVATAGITKLFFGYVETGPLLTAAIGVYIWAAVRVVQDRRGIVLATIAFLAAAAMHVTGLLLVPSYLYVMARWTGGRGDRWARAIPLLLLPVAAYMAFWFSQGGTLAGVWEAYRPYFGEFIPLAGPLDSKQAFTLFSLPRLTEFLNEQLFIGPFALLALALAFVAGAKGSDDTAPARRFLVWILVPFLLLSIVFNRKLGGARDWDLLANLAVPALLLTGLMLRSARPPKTALPAAAVALLAVSLFHLLGIVLVDAREDTSIRNYVQLFAPNAPVSRFARSYALEEVGQHYIDTGRGDLAVPFFEDAANTDPGNVRAVGTLGTMYTALGRRDEAIPLLRDAVRLRPDMAMNHYNLAAAYAAGGQWADAAASFETAVAKNPDLLPAWTGWGTTLNQQGKPAEADSVARAGLVRYPDDPDLLMVRATALERLGRADEAADVYRALLDVAPENTGALFNLSRLELDARKLDAAVGHLETLTRLSPQDAEARVNLGIAYAGLERTDEAIAAFRGAIAASPKMPQPYINLATLYQQRGDLAQAADVLEAFAAQDSATAAQLNLARIIQDFRARGNR